VSSKQLSLEGLEASLAAKSKELQEVLGQLQAAAAQEFQDSKKLLLEEGGCGDAACLLSLCCHSQGVPQSVQLHFFGQCMQPG
jgi:hypothetical protein